MGALDCVDGEVMLVECDEDCRIGEYTTSLYRLSSPPKPHLLSFPLAIPLRTRNANHRFSFRSLPSSRGLSTLLLLFTFLGRKVHHFRFSVERAPPLRPRALHNVASLPCPKARKYSYSSTRHPRYTGLRD